jgi:hypothetical protein
MARYGKGNEERAIWRAKCRQVSSLLNFRLSVVLENSVGHRIEINDFAEECILKLD